MILNLWSSTYKYNDIGHFLTSIRHCTTISFIRSLSIGIRLLWSLTLSLSLLWREGRNGLSLSQLGSFIHGFLTSSLSLWQALYHSDLSTCFSRFFPLFCTLETRISDFFSHLSVSHHNFILFSKSFFFFFTLFTSCPYSTTFSLYLLHNWRLHSIMEDGVSYFPLTLKDFSYHISVSLHSPFSLLFISSFQMISRIPRECRQHSQIPHRKPIDVSWERDFLPSTLVIPKFHGNSRWTWWGIILNQEKLSISWLANFSHKLCCPWNDLSASELVETGNFLDSFPFRFSSPLEISPVHRRFYLEISSSRI